MPAHILFSPLSQTGNAEAVERATVFAERQRARLTLLGVVPEPSRLQVLLEPPELLRSVIDQATDDLAAEFARWCPTPARIEREAIVSVGDPAATIIERVDREGFDLVIVTADPGELHDPAVKRLLRHCPCPVWVERPTTTTRLDVLAAINPDPDEVELNRLILQTAAMMQSLNGGRLYVLHAWEFFAETTLRHSAFLHPSEATVDEIVEDEHAAHRQALEEVIRSVDIDLPPIELHLRRGRPDDAINRFIEDHPIDLLVIGTVARHGVAGLVIGNTAEKVLDVAPCSVVAVKPDWFT